jgi:hypothetical protein
MMAVKPHIDRPRLAHMIRETSFRKALSGNLPPDTVEVTMETFEKGMHYGRGYAGT